MADRIKGITIEIGGDTTKLSQALKGTNAEIKNTQTQLKDVERLLKLDPKNTELLRQKQVLLKQAITETSSKLKTLHEAEKQLKDSGVDKNSAQFMGLKREIAETEAQQKKFKSQAKDAAKALAENTAAAKAAKTALEGLKGAAKVAGTAIAAVGAAAATATVAGAKATIDAAKAGAQYADTLLTQSTVTGISTDKLQEYAYAAELVDVSIDTLTGALAKNTRSMSSARTGTGAAADAYAKLGVEVTDANGDLRNSEEVFWDVIDALGNVENETERDALSMELFGRSAQELNPLIEAGADRLAELGKQARDAGAVLSGDTLQAYGAFDDQLRLLENNAGAAKNALGTLLLPALTDLSTKGVEALSQITGAINAAEGDAGKAIDNVLALLPGFMAEVTNLLPEILSFLGSLFSSVLKAIVENLPSIIQTILEWIPTLIQTLVENIPTLLAFVGSLFKTLAETLISSMHIIIDGLYQIINAIVDWIVEPETLSNLITAAIQLAVAIVTGIIKGLPEIIARLPEIVLAIAAALIDNLPIILEATWEITKAVFDAFKNTDWSGIWQGIVTAAQNVWTKIKKVFEPAADFFKKLWDGIVSGLKNALNVAIKALNKMIDGVNKMLAPLQKAVGAVGKLTGDKFSGENIQIPHIPLLAKGGVLSSGSAIVGEAGPELITMLGNRAVVQPLSTTTNNNTVDAPITINVYGTEGQDVNELADIVARRIQLHVSAKMGAY